MSDFGNERVMANAKGMTEDGIKGFSHTRLTASYLPENLTADWKKQKKEILY